MTQHLNYRTGQHVHGITPTGRIIRTGEYYGRQLRTSQTTADGGEYEALVTWDGDTEPSPVSFDRLTPAGTTPAADVDQAITDATHAARTYQAAPTDAHFEAMTDAIDRATALGATRQDLRAALYGRAA